MNRLPSSILVEANTRNNFIPARDLLGRETQNAEVAEAVALFGFQVKKWVGAFSTMLGGLDILVFADGIGENAPRGRAQICYGLGFLGIELEKTKRGQRRRDFRAGQPGRCPRHVHGRRMDDRKDGLPIGKEDYDENEKD